MTNWLAQMQLNNLEILAILDKSNAFAHIYLMDWEINVFLQRK